MAFDPKTFNLDRRAPLVKAWTEVETRIDKYEHSIFIPLGKRTEAYAQLHQMNRVRVAYRAQKEDGFRFDHIKARVAKSQYGWGISFWPNVMDDPNFKYIVEK